jgi:hypothetical protein
MITNLPIDLVHANIAARLTSRGDAESAFFALPALLPPTRVSLRVPPTAERARAAAAAWLRSPAAAAASGLETRAELRLDGDAVDPLAIRATLEALAATKRRVVAIELLPAGAAPALAPATGPSPALAVPPSASVDALAFFADVVELLGVSLREVTVHGGIKLRVPPAGNDDAEAKAPTPPRPNRFVLLDALELDGAVRSAGELLHLVEHAIRPLMHACKRLVVRFSSRTGPTLRSDGADDDTDNEDEGELLARACALLRRDAMGSACLREVEVTGLRTPRLERVRAAFSARGEERGPLERLRLGAAAAAAATAAATTAPAATTTITASVLEAEWTFAGKHRNPSFVAMHARVNAGAAAAAASGLAPAVLATALTDVLPSAPLSAVGALNLLLPPACLGEDDNGLVHTLRAMPNLTRLRLAVMAKSEDAAEPPSASPPPLQRALAAVAAADPAALRSLEVCGGLATSRAEDAVALLKPLLSTGEGARMRRSLRVLKVTAAVVGVVGAAAAAAPPTLPPRLAAALPCLRTLSLNNLLSEASSRTLPTLRACDLPAGLERLDLRGWRLVAAAHDAPSAELTHLSLRSCALSPSLAAAACAFAGATDVVLCGGEAVTSAGDDDADTAARAWPRLRSLATAGSGGALPAIVAAAARNCPQLRELRLQGLEELDAVALADALRPAARTLRVLEVAALANGGGEAEEEEEAAVVAAPPPGGRPDAASVARALEPLQALRRLRVKAPGWRPAQAAMVADLMRRPWTAVEAVVGLPRLRNTADARAFVSAAMA